MLDKHKSYNKHEVDRFIKELFLISYIEHKVAEIQKVRKHSLTRFTKIAANYIEDWAAIGNIDGYMPYMQSKPNKYGMVAAMPPSVTDKYIPIYKLDTIASERNLWSIKEVGADKWVMMLSDTSTLEKILTDADKNKEFDFKFTQFQLGAISVLSKMYSKLTTNELNILASHRTTTKSQDCLDYEFRGWETDYQRVFSSIKSTRSMAPDVKNKILEMTIYCEQIELKVDYALNGINHVIKKIENISSDFEELGKSLIMTIIQELKKSSKLNMAEEFNLPQEYILNRKYLYPINKLFVEISEKFFHESLSYETKFLRMRRNLERPPINEVEYSLLEFGQYQNLEECLGIIELIHDKAVKDGLGKNLLRPYISHSQDYIEKDYLEDTLKWDVGDGNDEDAERNA